MDPQWVYFVDPSNSPPTKPSLEEEFLQESKADRLKSFFIIFQDHSFAIGLHQLFFSTFATCILGEMIVTCREWLGASRLKNKKMVS